MLRRFHHLAAIAAIAIVAAAPAHAADFLTAIDDVPLAKGLTELPEPVVFESDQGRVVRTSAEGRIDASEISAFYRASLPSLGWKLVEDPHHLAFERENERLNIDTREPANNRPVTVSFELGERRIEARVCIFRGSCRVSSPQRHRDSDREACDEPD